MQKVNELPQANKTKVAERCVRTTLKMFRKAELEKAEELWLELEMKREELAGN